MKKKVHSFEKNNAFAESRGFDKTKTYFQVFSEPDKYGDSEFIIWWWGNSINSDFKDVWLGQAYLGNLEKNIESAKEKGKTVEIIK